MTLTSNTKTTLGVLCTVVGTALGATLWILSAIASSEEKQQPRIESIERNVVAISHRLDLFEARVTGTLGEAVSQAQAELWIERLRAANSDPTRPVVVPNFPTRR